MALVQYNDRETTGRNRRPNYYRKPDQEIVDEKTIRSNSSSRIDGRMLFGAEQADNGGDAPTEGSGGNHRKQRVLQVLHLRSRLGAGRATVSCGVTTYHGLQGPRRQGGRVARRIRLASAPHGQGLY